MANGAPTVSNGLVISGVTTTSDVNVGQGVTFTQTGNATFTGIVTATSFVGSGANLTSLPSSQLTGALPAIDGSNLTGISGVTINNNAPSSIITGSNVANTLEANSNLSWNGTKLQLEKSVNAYMQPAINVYNSYDGGWGGEIRFSAKYSGNEEVQARIRTYGGSHADDGSLSIETGAPSEAVRITSAGDVLIPGTQATSSETGKLDIYHTADGDINNPHIRLWGTTNADPRIEFGSPTNSGEGGYIMYNDSDEALYIGSRMATYSEVNICTGMNDGDPATNIRHSVNASGQVTKPSQPSFAAYRNVDGYSLNGDDFSFNATLHNIGSHFNTSNYRFTAPVNGRYLFTFYSILNTQINNGVYSIRVNGSGGYGQYVHFTTTNSSWDHVSTSWILNLSANDYVTMRSDSNIGWHGNSWQRFCGELLS